MKSFSIFQSKLILELDPNPYSDYRSSNSSEYRYVGTYPGQQNLAFFQNDALQKTKK